MFVVFCDKLITHVGESGLVRLSNRVWFRNVNNGAVWAQSGLLRHREKSRSKALGKTCYTSGSNQHTYILQGASLECKAVHWQDGLTFSAVLLE